MTPEEKARLEIDKKLEAAGWVIQDKYPIQNSKKNIPRKS